MTTAKDADADTVFFTAHDLAKRYQVHLQTIFGWASTGRLPKPLKFGNGTTRWRSDHIYTHEEKLNRNTETKKK
jgi:predicted DNA-binding transcriptional regulator AlpA